MSLPTWSTACPDWENRIIERQSLVTFDPLFPAEAEAALEIYKDFELVDVAGRPTLGQASAPWAFDLPRALFGSYNAETGRRHIRTYFELIAKKNAKSTRAGAIMTTALIRNWRDSGEFYILAPTKEVADNSFKPAWDAIKAREDWDALLHVKPNQRTITHRNTGAFLKVVAADSDTVAGKKTIGLLVDELWLFGMMANADAMLREAAGGLLSRAEGFVIYLSTQSDSAPAGVFAQQLEIFRAIRDGKIVDNTSLPLLYEFPERMLKSGGYRERKNWYIPNPNLRRSVDEEIIETELAKAKRSGKKELVNAEAKFLNVQVGIGSFEWRGADFWEKRVDTKLRDLDVLLKCSEVVTFGVDGGGLDDLLGIAVMGREKETRRWLLWNHAWADPGVLEIRKDIAPALLDFKEEGTLTICGGPDDVAGVAEVFKQVLASGLLPEKDAVGVDPNNVAAIIEALIKAGMTDKMLRRLRADGGALSPAWWGLERKLSDGTISHGGTKLMNFAVSNAKAEPRGNGILITKQISGRAKIDPLIATGCATILMSWNPDAQGLSVYGTRGALVL